MSAQHHPVSDAVAASRETNPLVQDRKSVV